MTCDRYSHKSKVFWHRKYLNVPKSTYCDKLYISINSVIRKSRNKIKGTKRTKIIILNAIIENLPIRNKIIATILNSPTNNLQTTSQKMKSTTDYLL